MELCPFHTNFVEILFSKQTFIKYLSILSHILEKLGQFSHYSTTKIHVVVFQKPTDLIYCVWTFALNKDISRSIGLMYLLELYGVKQLTSYSNFFMYLSCPDSVRQNIFLSPAKHNNTVHVPTRIKTEKKTSFPCLSIYIQVFDPHFQCYFSYKQIPVPDSHKLPNFQQTCRAMVSSGSCTHDPPFVMVSSWIVLITWYCFI